MAYEDMWSTAPTYAQAKETRCYTCDRSIRAGEPRRTIVEHQAVCMRCVPLLEPASR